MHKGVNNFNLRFGLPENCKTFPSIGRVGGPSNLFTNSIKRRLFQMYCQYQTSTDKTSTQIEENISRNKFRYTFVQNQWQKFSR